jgi:hypothetical protein
VPRVCQTKLGEVSALRLLHQLNEEAREMKVTSSFPVESRLKSVTISTSGVYSSRLVGRLVAKV